MEEEKRSQINEFLSKLVDHTLCKAPFLEFFVEKEIFSLSDIDTIKAKHQETEQASEFYRLIQTRANSYPILIEALQKTGQSDIVTILETGVIPPTINEKSRVRQLLYGKENVMRMRGPLDNPDPTPHSNTTFDVTEPVSIFTGRRNEIENLHKMVLRSGANGKPTVISQLTSISGLGGIGKTQLARQYVKEHGSDFDGNCIWLEGETENSLSTGFRTLAKDKLGFTTDYVNGADKGIKSVVADVYKYFSQSKCLFVFDNVEKCAWLLKYLPKSSNSCSNIIITSRNREWKKGIEVIDLFELEEKDAFQMVKAGLELENDSSQDEVILKLLRKVQCFPLALHQAVSYILDQQRTCEYSVETYLENFKRKKRELLSFGGNEGENFELLNDYAMTTFTTWKMTIEKIGEGKDHGELALQILYSMAYLSPEKIKREFFLCHPNIKADDAIDKVKSAVKLLVKFSMVRAEDRQRLLSIHRLVQEVMRADLIRRNMEHQTLGNSIKMLLEHEERFPMENGTHLTTASLHLFKCLGGSPESLRNSREDIEQLLVEGRYAEFTDKFGRDSLERMCAIFDCGDEQILEILQKLAVTMSRGLRSELFVELQNDATSAMAEIDGWDSDRINNLGLKYYDFGMFEASLVAFQKLCPTKDEYLRRPIIGTNLAMALLHLGKTQEALDISRSIYDNLKFPGQSDKSTLILVGRTLGLCMNGVQDYDGVLNMLPENYLREGALTTEETIQTCHYIRLIGTVLRNQGKYVRAMENHLEAYQKLEVIFGKEHIYPEICRTEIAEDLICVGSHDEAVNILEVTLPKLETLIPNHYIILRKKVLFAEALAKQGKDVGRARDILEEAMDTLVERKWTKVAYFEKIITEITRIQNELGDKANE